MPVCLSVYVPIRLDQYLLMTNVTDMLAANGVHISFNCSFNVSVFHHPSYFLFYYIYHEKLTNEGIDRLIVITSAYYVTCL